MSSDKCIFRNSGNSALITAAQLHLAQAKAVSCLVHKPGADFIVAAGTLEEIRAMVRDTMDDD
jgi:hypothetical protein